MQASTDELSSICPPVHLRPHFYIFNGPSSESVHEMDGLSSSTVHLRPSRTNIHGLSSEIVHEVDGLCSSGRPPPSIYGKYPWSVVRFRPWDERSIRPAVHLRPPAMNYHGPSSKSVHEVDCPWVDGPWGGRPMGGRSILSLVYSWTRPPPSIWWKFLLSETVHGVDGPSTKIRPLVHLKIIILVYRPIPSMRWTVHDQKFVRLSTLKLLSWSGVRIRPWDGRSMVKNSVHSSTFKW